MINEPGIYVVPESDYHADNFLPEPSLSSSIARILIQDSPFHARCAHPRLNPDCKPQEARHLDLGSLCHALMLEGEDRACIIDAENYRTKAAQEARDAARLAGQYPILRDEMPEVHAMMRACREQLLETDCPDAFTNGKPEQTLVWQESNGIWCRARLDWLMSEKPVIFDYKTSARSAKPSNLSKMAAPNGWCIQSSFYKRGFKAVFGDSGTFAEHVSNETDGGVAEIARHLDPRFVFVCQENFAPFALSLMEVSPSDEALADFQVERAIQTFGECLKTGIWQGYSRHVERITSPAYYESSAMEEINAG